jgi:WS/DGAT/MGAT family acyltransferase
VAGRDDARVVGSSVDRLTPLDRFMLATSERWPQDIGALAVIDGAALLDPDGHVRIETVRAAIRSRLSLVPRFRQLVYTPRRGLGPPLWADDPAFDLDRHVLELPLPAPGGEDELLRVVEQLRRQPLDPSRPMWQMWFLTGLPESRIVLFVKLHHAIADGMAAMTTLAALLDTDPDAPAVPVRPWTPVPLPTPGELFADNLRRRLGGLSGALAPLARPRATLRAVRAAWPAVREVVAQEPGPETSLDRAVGLDRNIALIQSTLEQVRQVAHRYDATVNDVLLAATAGGLRALLRGRGEPVEDLTVPIYVPVSLRRGPRGPQQGNQIAQMVVPLPLGGSDPGRRLRQIAVATAERKSRRRTDLGRLIRGPRFVRRLLLEAVLRQRVNLTSASIPGPPQPLYLAGARLLEAFPLLPIVANEPLGVAALSYAGTFSIGITADRDAIPDIDVFADGVRDELHALGARMGTMGPCTGAVRH